MNFNIIENPEPEYNIEEIIQDYNNYNIRVSEIQAKHGITRSTWHNTILRKLREHKVPLRDPRIHYKPRYYYKIGKRYRVQRVINGKCKYFGYYNTIEEAQAKVKELEENNWNGLLQEKKNTEKKKPKYYSKRLCRGIPYWVVTRTFNKKINYFGYYRTEAEAQKRVKELHENGWNGLL